MQRVAYHRLAAAELIESARFYGQRRPGLGDECLSTTNRVRGENLRWHQRRIFLLRLAALSLATLQRQI
jgi:hypothetical protein